MTQATTQQLQSDHEEANSQIESIARSNKKTKVTVYLTEEAEQALAELYITRYRKNRKTDRSMIACDAIQMLYEKECMRVPSN